VWHELVAQFDTCRVYLYGIALLLVSALFLTFNPSALALVLVLRVVRENDILLVAICALSYLIQV